MGFFMYIRHKKGSKNYPRLKFEPKVLETWNFARNIHFKYLVFSIMSAELLLTSAFSAQNFPKSCQNWIIFKFLCLGNK